MPDLTVAAAGAVMTVTLNRPEVRNAVNLALAQQIARAMDELDETSSLRVGILTGAGPSFCAGMDLKAFGATGERPHVPGRGFAGLVARPPAKPIIAAIEGYALAGGLEIALACDLIVASREAMLGIPEAKRGLVAAAGGLLRLPERLPQGIAMEMALTGEPVSAERAAELGLVNILSEPGAALERAHALAVSIAENAPLSLIAGKRIVRESSRWSSESAWDQQSAISGPVIASEDAREGATAFTERRAPAWRGR